MRIDWTYTQDNQVRTEKRYADLTTATLVGESDYLYDGDGNITSLVSFAKDGSIVTTITNAATATTSTIG